MVIYSMNTHTWANVPTSPLYPGKELVSDFSRVWDAICLVLSLPRLVPVDSIGLASDSVLEIWAKLRRTKLGHLGGVSCICISQQQGSRKLEHIMWRDGTCIYLTSGINLTLSACSRTVCSSHRRGEELLWVSAPLHSDPPQICRKSKDISEIIRKSCNRLRQVYFPLHQEFIGFRVSCGCNSEKVSSTAGRVNHFYS